MAKPGEQFPQMLFGPGGQRAVFYRQEDIPPGWYEWCERHNIKEADAPKPEDGPDAWGGRYKADMVQMLRNMNEKVHANSTARSIHARLVAMGKITVESTA